MLAVGPTRPARAADGRFAYRLRGEVRLLLLWIGRDDVGGGHIIRNGSHDASTNQWTERIEVLFGSKPDRIPRRINRWGYGREISEWARDSADPTPTLLGTEFLGIMRHSTESSIEQVLASGNQGCLFDATRSRVLPAQASSELRVLTGNEEFDYRRPEPLLAKFGEALEDMPPHTEKRLESQPGRYGAPYGFLTGLSELIRQILERRAASPLTFVFNAKPYRLGVRSIRHLRSFETGPSTGRTRYAGVALASIRCFNTVKQTHSDFSLWLPTAGALKGIPVRILLQPRWWLRLQLDLDPKASRIGAAP